jgi:hypothetical protein
MKQPIIQTFNETTGEYEQREMTDDEYAEYLETLANTPPLGVNPG